MSGVPKNKANTAVLVRNGPADYKKLDAASFPVIQVEDAGAILEITDTGDRFRWTGAIWVKTHTQGLNGPVEVSGRGVQGVAVFVQDQTSDPVDLRMSEILNQTAIAVETVIDTSTLTVDPGHGIVAGNALGVLNLLDVESFFIGNALSVATNVITVDTPINKDYPVGALVLVNNVNLNVLGSLGSPRVFSVKPIPGLVGDVTRVIMEIQDNVAMDFSTFGGIGALTNGCVLRVKHGDGTYTNLFNFKTNGDFIARGFDHSFQTKSGGGLHSLVARSTWGGQSKRGIVLRLDGTLGEEIQIVIQDDLTAIDKFVMIVQGHLVQEGVS